MNRPVTGIVLAVLATALIVASLSTRAWWGQARDGVRVRVGLYGAEVCRTTRALEELPGGQLNVLSPGCSRGPLVSAVGRTPAALGLATLGASAAAVFALAGAVLAAAMRRSVRGTARVAGVFVVLSIAAAGAFVLARPAEMAGFRLGYAAGLYGAGALLALLAVVVLARARE